ncbi:MAG: hypothetical protein CBC35_00200 [Planctomycetes bacterium TMED75]|nr:hypothetical protein [Planctomycetaceae bacterium]OUU96952.1 MAG: hypothetical protein CBC35_00200 [Planctomycetes bacterium TMED75]
MKKIFFSTCIAAAAATTASADNIITMTLDSMPNYEAYSVALNTRLSWDSSESVTFTSPSIIAGERQWTNQYGREVISYCVQLYQSAVVGETIEYHQTRDLTNVPGAETAPGPMSQIQVGMVEDMYARFIDKRTGMLAENTSLTDGFDYATASAAFQLVLWEISHEDITGSSLDEARDQLSMEVGAFRAAEASSATELIISSLGEDGWESMNGLVGLQSATAQDQLMVVPLPAPILLAGIGLIGVAAVRRKMR